MSKKKKAAAWGPTALTIGLGALATLTPEIQQAVSQHPNVALGLGTLYAILKGIMPSPLKS